MTSHENIAARLREAYAGSPIAPLRDGLSPDDAAGAYNIQSINTGIWCGEGRRIIGRKVGLTSRAVQLQLGVDQPDYGVLYDDMLIPNGGTLSPSKVLQPKAEAEVAIVLAHDLCNPLASIQDIISATAYAIPAIEIVDSRIADWKITFAGTVADNGSSAYFVLGDRPRLLTGLDLWTCGMVLNINGKTVSLGAGAACLGHPLNAAKWLVRTLSAAGEGLKQGDVVLTGALGPMVALTPNDFVDVEIGGLGRCGFAFTANEQLP